MTSTLMPILVGVELAACFFSMAFMVADYKGTRLPGWLTKLPWIIIYSVILIAFGRMVDEMAVRSAALSEVTSE